MLKLEFEAYPALEVEFKADPALKVEEVGEAVEQAFQLALPDKKMGMVQHMGQDIHVP